MKSTLNKKKQNNVFQRKQNNILSLKCHNLKFNAWILEELNYILHHITRTIIFLTIIIKYSKISKTLGPTVNFL